MLDRSGADTGSNRRVLIIDDDAPTRGSVARLLASRGLAGVCADSVESALEIGRCERCGVAILDLALPGVCGVEGLCRIRELLAPIEVVVLTGTATVEQAMACVRHGAFDLLTKPAKSGDLMDCVERARTATQLCGLPSPQLCGLQTKLLLAARAWRLSQRQRDVLTGIVLGRSNKQIASQSGCAERTIEMHITELLRKARVDGRATLVAKFWLTIG